MKTTDSPTKLVLITWRDAISDSGWKNAKEVTEEAPIIHSVGWVVRQNRKSITLAGDIGSQDDDTNRRIEVPMKMVYDVAEIKVEVKGEEEQPVRKPNRRGVKSGQEEEVKEADQAS